ncbi:MAG: hypothetical protein ACNA7J_13285, partial [Wenzhouxiangella sp.]
MTRNIVCMKWGTKFPASDVNRLYSMVRRHMDEPFRFVCFTDDPAGLHGEIEAAPIPDVGWHHEPDINDRGWKKIGLFAEDLGLEGDALFLDLDVIVMRSLAPFFEQPGEIVLIRDYRLMRVRGDYFVGNTSVLRFPVGRYPELLDRFRREFPKIRREVRNEQEYVSHYFREKGLLAYWPKSWCPSFKYHCVRWGPMSYFMTPQEPVDARIVV